MDAEVLRRVAAQRTQGAPVRVVVAALAAAPGDDYRTAAGNGVAHYTALGAHAVAAPDARDDAAGAGDALAGADLVVLPGGSPSRLLEALSTTGVGALLVEQAVAGVAVSGASAGAMVLCGWSVVPDDGAPHVLPALGLVADAVVVPHWSSASDRRDWLVAIRDGVPSRVRVLGLPEESGVVVQAGVTTAVGRQPVRLVDAQDDVAPGRSWTMGPGVPRSGTSGEMISDAHGV
jgi:cyanophycinase-like exopeptidase